MSLMSLMYEVSLFVSTEFPFFAFWSTEVVRCVVCDTSSVIQSLRGRARSKLKFYPTLPCRTITVSQLSVGGLCGSSCPSSSCLVRKPYYSWSSDAARRIIILGLDVMQALKQGVLVKLRVAAGDGEEGGRDGAEEEVDEGHRGSGEMGTECGGGASGGAGDEGNSVKGPGGRISAGNDGGAGAGSRAGSKELGGAESDGSGAETAAGLVICGRQTVQLTVDPVSDIREVPNSD